MHSIPSRYYYRQVYEPSFPPSCLPLPLPLFPFSPHLKRLVHTTAINLATHIDGVGEQRIGIRVGEGLGRGQGRGGRVAVAVV